jgi:hypothetical protein
VLERVGLAARGGDLFKVYSMGMKQRLALAAALLNDPNFLILDEPTTGLDPAGIQETRAMLRQMVDEQGKSVSLHGHQRATEGQKPGRQRGKGDGRCQEQVPVLGLGEAPPGESAGPGSPAGARKQAVPQAAGGQPTQRDGHPHQEPPLRLQRRAGHHGGARWAHR